MKKLLFLAVMIYFLAPNILSAQVTIQTHGNTFTWPASPTTGVTGYNIYKLAGVCPVNPTLGAFGPKLASTTATVLTYTDSVVTPGVTNCYAITAFTAGGESGFSLTFQLTTPIITAVAVVTPPNPSSSSQ